MDEQAVPELPCCTEAQSPFSAEKLRKQLKKLKEVG